MLGVKEFETCRRAYRFLSDLPGWSYYGEQKTELENVLLELYSILKEEQYAKGDRGEKVQMFDMR